MILVISLFERTITLRFYGQKNILSVKDKPLLISLDQFLKEARKQWQDIDGVVVIFGDASFSIIRQVTTVLNTLTFTTHLKVVTVPGKVGDEENAARRGIRLLKRMKLPRLIKPFYSRPPNITKSKIA